MARSGCDHRCRELGIPTHLHTCGKKADDRFETKERVYRRSPYIWPDITRAVSFEASKNSVNRSKYCKRAQDVLIKTETGERYPEMYVISISVTTLHEIVWSESDQNDRIVTRIQHAPEQCNYAHCNVQVVKGGEVVPKLKAGAVKSKIREAIAKEAVIELPESLYGHRLGKKSSAPDIHADGATCMPPKLTKLWFLYLWKNKGTLLKQYMRREV